MLTIQTAPANATVSFVGTKTSVNETTSSVNIIANLQDAISTSSSVDIEILPISTATSGSDFILPASLKFEWSPGQNLVNDTITININNDIISENAEYFIVRFINPVNIKKNEILASFIYCGYSFIMELAFEYMFLICLIIIYALKILEVEALIYPRCLVIFLYCI